MPGSLRATRRRCGRSPPGWAGSGSEGVAQTEWLGGLVVHRGEDLAEMEPGIRAVPAHRLF